MSTTNQQQVVAPTPPFEWRANNSTPTTTTTTTQNHSKDVTTGRLFATAPFPGSPLIELTNVDDKKSDRSNNDIAPMPGDNLFPPNSVDARMLNGIAVPVSASAGWSTSPPREKVYPSAMCYSMNLKSSKGNGIPRDSLELEVSLEFTNPKFNKQQGAGESMVVKVSVGKTLVHSEHQKELDLVATGFQEYVDSKWIDITADVEYTQTADAVVDAVLKDPKAGQTAGKATIQAKTIDLTLGPFSEKARLNLTFQYDSLYTYQAMSLSADAADIGSQRLLPLWVVLPFAHVDSEAGLTSLSVRLTAPTGTNVLSTDQCAEAYHHLKQQQFMEHTTIVAVKELDHHRPDESRFHLTWGSLPPRSCGVLAWLTLPNKSAEMDVDDDDYDFVDVAKELGELKIKGKDEQAHAVVQVPSQKDLELLRVPLPGLGPVGSLFRVNLTLPKAQPRRQPMILFNLNLSDKSASTRRIIDNVSMRTRFNELAESRLLKRLESIPALVEAGVLKPEDVWVDIFLPFDHQAPESSIQKIMFRVQDVIDDIQATVNEIRNSSFTLNPGASMIAKHVCEIRKCSPRGRTDFSVGPRTLLNQQYAHDEPDAEKLLPINTGTNYLKRAFVEFDTDGGHNGAGDYLNHLMALCTACNVENGVVTGFGSWLNQDCATKVANILGTVPAQLALEIPAPGTEGLNQIFRRSFSAWLGALRQPPPLCLTVSAGSVSSFPPLPSIRRRNFNAVEVLALSSLGVQVNTCRPSMEFGAPDVADEDFTKAVIERVPSSTGEFNFYIMSRYLSATQLAAALNINVSDPNQNEAQHSIKAAVSTRSEELSGNFIAFEWLKLLSKQTSKSRGQLIYSPLMSTGLATRFEDEVSFRFNIASPSGRTSYLGRCKTNANRASIDQDHQPPAPNAHWLLLPPIPQHEKKRPPINRQRKRHCSGARKAGTNPPDQARDQFLGGLSLNVTPYAGSFGGGSAASHSASAMANAPTPYLAAFGATATRSPSDSLMFGSPTAFASSRSCKRKSYAQASSSSSSSTQQSETIQNHWGFAPMVIPVDFGDARRMEQAIRAIAHARQRLLHDPSIPFYCNICHRVLQPDVDERYHCFDCEDYDLCYNCRDGHFKTSVAHRTGNVNVNISVNKRGHQTPTTNNDKEDPLVATLLSPSSSSSSNANAHGDNNNNHDPERVALPSTDRTMEWCQRRVERFLLSILQWWPLFRASLSYGDQQLLPSSISEELADKIHSCCIENENATLQQQLLETVTIVIDTLQRVCPSTTSSSMNSTHANNGDNIPGNASDLWTAFVSDPSGLGFGF